MSDGWIRLYRELLEKPIFKKPDLMQLFIYCLLKANHKPVEIIWNNKKMVIQKGQFITGRHKLSEDLCQNARTTYDRLKILENLEIINIKTNNKFTLVTVVNYELYQNNHAECNNQTNNKPTTNQQQTNTNNNDNNDNNIINNNNDNDKKNPPPTQSVNRVVTVMGKGEGLTGREGDILTKIFKIAGIDNYPETTALFMRGVLTKMWSDAVMPLSLKMGLKHEQIKDCLRHIKPEHVETAFQALEKCKRNKKIYFAKALISAITENGIEENFEEEGVVNNE